MRMPHFDLDPDRPFSQRIAALADALDAVGDALSAGTVREVGEAYRERLADGHVDGALAALARLRPFHAPLARPRAA